MNREPSGIIARRHCELMRGHCDLMRGRSRIIARTLAIYREPASR